MNLQATGRKMIRDNLTSGIVKNGLGVRYWTRVNGCTTYGPTRTTKQQAEVDRLAALAGNPPKVMNRTGRRKAGLCFDCYDPALPGFCRCDFHLRISREKGEQKRRRYGIRTREEFLREPSEARRAAAKALSRVDKGPRCRCGLLLPCYHVSLEHVAEARRGDGLW